MTEAASANEHEDYPAHIDLPAVFSYPTKGIIGRCLLGAAVVAIGAGVVAIGGWLAIIIGVCISIFGAITAAENLWALLDRDRRVIALAEDSVEVRYGFSTRRYFFARYGDFHIAKVGLRPMLTALPLEPRDITEALSKDRRVSVLLKPAVLSPMPPFGNGAPETLETWAALLKSVRERCGNTPKIRLAAANTEERRAL